MSCVQCAPQTEHVSNSIEVCPHVWHYVRLSFRLGTNFVRRLPSSRRRMHKWECVLNFFAFAPNITSSDTYSNRLGDDPIARRWP